jgi:hypothetical protein
MTRHWPFMSRLADQELLEQAARQRGLSTASFVASVIHLAASERLLDAIVDDRD